MMNTYDEYWIVYVITRSTIMLILVLCIYLTLPYLPDRAYSSFADASIPFIPIIHKLG